jgi:hypothetical protein
VSPHRLRESAAVMVVQWIQAHCNEDADPTEVVRTLIDAVQVRIGSHLLRELPRARVYHATSGVLDEFDLLAAGSVQRLIRQATGMSEDRAPNQTERHARDSITKRRRGRS